MGILIAGLVLGELYLDRTLGVPEYYTLYAYPAVLYIGLVLATFRSSKLYEFPALFDFSSSVGAVLGGLVRAFSFLVVLGFVLNVANDYSRIWVVSWFAASAVMVLLGRALMSRLFSELIARGYTLQTVILYGPWDHVLTTAERIQQAGTGVGIVGLFDSDRAQGAGADGQGQLKDLLGYARSHTVDTIAVVVDPGRSGDLEDVLSTLSVLPIDVQILFVSGRDGAPAIGTAGAHGLRAFDIQTAPISRWGRAAKALFDYLAALCLVIVLAPLFAAIALAIRLDSAGPIFFHQQRHGLNQRVFRVWKFRTMHVQEDGDGVVQAVRRDARVTRVGHWLRRTSLDELPQLFNVLLGEMSLVGPRPHPLNLNVKFEHLLERYANRHKVKPGITGLAQIYGHRGPTETVDAMRRRLEQDLRYIETWSLWLDFKILAATPFLGIVNRNAF